VAGLLCALESPQQAATLLALGAPGALRAAAAPAEVGCDDSLRAAVWAAGGALHLHSAAQPCSGAQAQLPGEATWALDVLAAALSGRMGVKGAESAVTIAGTLMERPTSAAIARHPGMLSGLCVAAVESGDEDTLGTAASAVLAAASHELHPRTSSDAQAAFAGVRGAHERGDPHCRSSTLGLLRFVLGALAKTADAAIAGEVAAGLAALKGDSGAGGGAGGSRGSSGGSGTSSVIGGDGGGGGGSGSGSTGTSGSIGTSSSRGGGDGDSSGAICGNGEGEGKEPAAPGTSQREGERTPAPPRQPKACAMCGKTETQLGRPPKACAGCRSVRCARCSAAC
jgi:hypothetical protein